MTETLDEAAIRARLVADYKDTDALRELGLSFAQQGRAAEAAAMLADVAERNPCRVALTELAAALRQAGLYTECEARLRQALALSPDDVTTQFALGTLMVGLERGQDALPWLRAAVAANHPGGVEALGAALLLCGNAAFFEYDTQTAERYYREAIALRPDFAAAHGNLGHTLTLECRTEESLAAYRTAIELEPDNDGIAFGYALALLRDGQFEEGWRYHERRHNVAQMQVNYDRRPGLPRWQPGTDLAGKRVLLLSEQGHGDLIQYVRYATLLIAQGAQVIVEVSWNLRRLFETFDGVRVITMDDPTPGCDVICPLVSLPFYFGTSLDTIPRSVPYLHPPEDLLAQWAAWLGPMNGRRRIGLVCSGDPNHPHDRLRSIPLSQLAPILDLPGHQCILLQTELRDADRAVRDGRTGLRFPGPALADFADTAALIANLDLVITVDSAVAHLAGALGKPTWVMLPFAPDYRWLLGRDDSPWYPSARLYRQTTLQDWTPVIEAITRDLTRG